MDEYQHFLISQVYDKLSSNGLVFKFFKGLEERCTFHNKFCGLHNLQHRSTEMLQEIGTTGCLKDVESKQHKFVGMDRWLNEYLTRSFKAILERALCPRSFCGLLRSS